MKTRSMGTQQALDEAVHDSNQQQGPQSPTMLIRNASTSDWEDLDTQHNVPLHEQYSDIPAFVVSPVRVVAPLMSATTGMHPTDCLRTIAFCPVAVSTIATLQPRRSAVASIGAQPHDAQYACSQPDYEEYAELTTMISSRSDEPAPPVAATATSSHVRSSSSSWDFDETAEYASSERPSLSVGLRQQRRSNTNRHHRRTRSRDSPTDFSLNNNNNNSRHTRSRSKWLIPAEHPVKLLWDVLTIALSVANAYATHKSIRDKQFGATFTSMAGFWEMWFVLDIFLNFVTERPIGGGVVLTDFSGIVARYLTTWFVVDALSLVPGELLYLKPIIDQQNRRGFIKRYFFKTRAAIRVSRLLRGTHVRLFGKVARQTKRAGMGGAHRLLRVIIKYAPKYVLFVKNMKGVVAVRGLRLVHWLRKVWFNFVRRTPTKMDDDTHSLTEGYDDDDFMEYDDDDDDDGDYYYNNNDGGTEYYDENPLEDSFVDGPY